MRVVEEESSLMSWVTVVALIGLIAVGAIAYQNRERFFPSAIATPKVGARMSEATESKFFEARDKIVGGQYDEASAIFRTIDTDKVPQPARNWMTMQNGLARLLAGDLPGARAEFAKVEKRGVFSGDPRDAKLAKFFVEASRLAASEEPVKGDAAKNYDLESTESFGLLVFGLKDWALGQFDDANELLRQFKMASPPDSEIWLRRYKSFGDAYVESYSAFQMANEAASGASDNERKEAALKQVQSAKAKIKGQPALIAKLNDLEKGLKEHVEKVAMANAAADEAAEAADRQILNDVKARVAAYNEKYNFGDALQIVFTATVEGDKAKAELDNYLKRTQWLSKFKSKLVSDINANGYTKPLTKKDSSSVPAIKEADDSQLLTPTKAAVPWHDLASDSIIAMAKDYLAKATAPEETNERKWLLGNFIYQSGRKGEALTLMREAAQANPEYKDGLALFPEK